MAKPTEADIAAMEELNDTLREIHSDRIREAPPVLYHYTTSGGILGILADGFFRGSNFSFMNDSSEFTYGVDLVLKRFQKESRERDKDNRVALIIGVLGEVWMQEQASLAETYLACFTEARDDLNQWRGYGGTADRYCLGVDVAHLTQRTRYSFAPVIYSREEQDELLSAYFEATSRFLSKQLATISEWLEIASVRELCRWLLESIAFFKDTHFASEREWRAVRSVESVKKEELYFDASNGSVRPFVRLYKADGAKLPITEVIVQSPRHDERGTKAAALLLARYGYDQTKVVESEIPFRTI
jgi:hypothetical protein